MPSMVVGYVPGSGFSPLISGTPWSGQFSPVGGFQLRADAANSGAIYVSLSGGNFFSGQYSTLVTSGGPTITSGARPLSGGLYSGLMDGMPMLPGDSLFIPHLGIQNTGSTSGTYSICIGADPACSGPFARVYLERY